MIIALSVLVVLMGLVMALRPERVTTAALRNSLWQLSERFIGHYKSSVWIVGIVWLVFGGYLLVVVLRDTLRTLS